MNPDIFFYICAIIAVFFTGLSKGGFAGFGAMAMPMMALGGDPLTAAAILLPILISQDLVGMWSFRKFVNKRIVMIMLPSMTLGVFLGYLYLLYLPKEAILGAVGAISLFFGLNSLRKKLLGKIEIPTNSHAGIGTLFGTITGFTSQIAHAGGPPFYMWILPQKFPRDILIGTKTVCFCFVNWIKVPAFLALGQMTTENLKTSIILMPIAIAATFIGVALIKRINTDKFYIFIYIVMCLIGLKLLFEAIY